MRVLQENATEILYEKAIDLKHQPHNSWRCLHVDLADYRMQHDYSLFAHFMAQAIIKRLENADGYIFICEDGDIVVLFQGVLRTVMDKLGILFEEMHVEMLRASSNSTACLLDLSKDWDEFFALCRRKWSTQLPVVAQNATARELQ